MLTGLTGTVAAQDKADLKWKFEKDKAFFQELATRRPRT